MMCSIMSGVIDGSLKIVARLNEPLKNEWITQLPFKEGADIPCAYWVVCKTRRAASRVVVVRKKFRSVNS